MFFEILNFWFFFLTLRFKVLQTCVARHIPSFLQQFAFFFCMTMSFVFFLALRFQFLIIFAANCIPLAPYVCDGCYEQNEWHCWSKFIALLRFLFHYHYQVLTNFVIVIFVLHHKRTPKILNKLKFKSKVNTTKEWRVEVRSLIHSTLRVERHVGVLR